MPEATRGKTRRGLDVFFKPKSVAVVGASSKEGSIGRAVLWNLISNPFNGTVYPVNPKQRSVLGIRAYASVTAIPEKVELAVVITPAKSVPAVIAECAQVGVTSALIISNGFREVGPQGMELEQRVLAIARKGGMRLMGPSCLGVLCPISGINASASSGHAAPWFGCAHQ